MAEQVRQSESAKQKQNVLGNILTNKQNRSAFILLLSVLLILGINSVLPMIEGSAHYTAEAIEVTYKEYQDKKATNINYRITWASEQRIVFYKNSYIRSHPELTEEEKLEITVPDNFKVNMYTKFFFESSFWYVSTATSIMSAVILYYSIFNYLITKSKDKNADYLKIKTEVDTMVRNGIDPETFEPWMYNVFNIKRKIAQHKTNVKYALDKLEKSTPYRIRRKFREYFSELGEAEMPELKWYQFRHKHYVNKKEQLLNSLEDDYIAQSVIGGKVKYFKHIYPTFVYSGYDTVSRSVDSYSQIITDAKRISSDAMKKVLISIMITTMFTVLFTVTAVTSFEQEPLWIVLNAVSKIVPLFIQIPLAFDYSNEFLQNQLIGNMMNRRAIGLLYLAEIKKSNITKEGEDDATKN